MRAAFEEYVATRGGRLLRFAYVLCGDQHLAEDLVQDVLSRVHRRWGRIEAAEPDAYLRSAIVRAHLSWRRRRSSGERVLAEVPETPSHVDFTHQLAQRDEVWRRLATLPRMQRTVLVLRYFEDLDDHRIAEVIGRAPATVRGHAARGLATLRRLLEAEQTTVPSNGDLR